ncbi:MAG: hypothetical protein EOO22_00630 [Comamonadaceae bacterium]|nr:MAG: hypothetical protein EOO22_00630 [Comamonadaceae bacterium]
MNTPSSSSSPRLSPVSTQRSLSVAPIGSPNTNNQRSDTADLAMLTTRLRSMGEVPTVPNRRDGSPRSALPTEDSFNSRTFDAYAQLGNSDKADATTDDHAAEELKPEYETGYKPREKTELPKPDPSQTSSSEQPHPDCEKKPPIRRKKLLRQASSMLGSMVGLKKAKSVSRVKIPEQQPPEKAVPTHEQKTVARVRQNRMTFLRASAKYVSVFPDLFDRSKGNQSGLDVLELKLNALKQSELAVTREEVNELYKQYCITCLIADAMPYEVPITPGTLLQMIKAVQQDLGQAIGMVSKASRIPVLVRRQDPFYLDSYSPAPDSLDALPEPQRSAKLATIEEARTQAEKKVRDAICNQARKIWPKETFVYERPTLQKAIRVALEAHMKFKDADLKVGFLRSSNDARISAVKNMLGIHAREQADALYTIVHAELGNNKYATLLGDSELRWGKPIQPSLAWVTKMDSLIAALSDCLVQSGLSKELRTTCRIMFDEIDWIGASHGKDPADPYLTGMKQVVLKAIYLNFVFASFVQLASNESPADTSLQAAVTWLGGQLNTMVNDPADKKNADDPPTIRNTVQMCTSQIQLHMTKLARSIAEEALV